SSVGVGRNCGVGSAGFVEWGQVRMKFLAEEAVDEGVVMLAAGEHGAAESALQGEAETFVEALGRLVEIVDVDGDFLITQLFKEEAEDEVNGFAGVATALVGGVDEQAVAEGSGAAVTGVGED